MRNAREIVTLALLFATCAMANGKITIINHSSHNLSVDSFDRQDGALWQERDAADIAVGETATVTCWKTLTDKNAPGCKISIDTSDNMEVIRAKSLRNGYYEVTSGMAVKKLTGSEVTIQKTHLLSPSGGTTDCVYKGSEVVLATNGMATLKWQLDGDLALHDNQGVQWSTGTANPDTTGVCFQGDGNLVVYRKGGAYWSTHTSPNGQVMKLQADCNIVIQDANGYTLWQAGTYCRP